MGRAMLAIGLLLSAVVLPSCGGGGGSSPTEPTPPPPPSLAGTWRGEISGAAGGAAFTCALELTLEQDEQDEDIFVGSWEADCPDRDAAGVMAAFEFGGVTFLTALSVFPGANAHALATCGWSAEVTARGNELSGTWNPPQNCEDASIAGGPVRVRFVG